MSVPLCIQECTDPRLKQKALAIFNRGTEEEILRVIAEIMVPNQSNEQEDVVKQRMEKIEKWKSHHTRLNSILSEHLQVQADM